ncbi:MAG: hypothetical protein KJ710_07885, partial [Candidatus Omnitrophica bacterium]|nr:hypothetical protein [Candidatus Omnitrophota bacterium]
LQLPHTISNCRIEIVDSIRNCIKDRWLQNKYLGSSNYRNTLGYLRTFFGDSCDFLKAIASIFLKT